jgi:hypothetical protein
MTTALFDAPSSATSFDAPALLGELRRRGAALERRGDKLHLEAPRGTIGDLLPDVARFKPQLLELLTVQPMQPQAPSEAPRHLCDFPSAAAIVAASRRLHPFLVSRLDAAARNRLAVALACLDCGIDPALRDI